MGILDFFKGRLRQSKHQVHVRKSKRKQRGGRIARADVQVAGTKLAKYFEKAPRRGPRGY